MLGRELHRAAVYLYIASDQVSLERAQQTQSERVIEKIPGLSSSYPFKTTLLCAIRKWSCIYRLATTDTHHAVVARSI